MGRNSLKTKLATIVISGIENEQMDAPGAFGVRLGIWPLVSRFDAFGETILTAAFLPMVVFSRHLCLHGRQIPAIESSPAGCCCLPDRSARRVGIAPSCHSRQAGRCNRCA